jgi:hypothetical protein
MVTMWNSTTHSLRTALAKAFLLAGCSACFDSGLSGDLPQSGPQVTVMSAHVDEIAAGRMFGNIGRAALVGGVLWIRDLAGDPFIHAIDTTSGNLIRSFGRVGDAGGEFHQVTGLFGRPGDDSTLWVWDARSGRLSGLPISGQWPVPTSRLRLTDMAPGGIAVALGDQLVMWKQTEAAFSIVGIDGRSADVHPIELEGLAGFSKAQIVGLTNGAALCAADDGGEFAIAHRFSGRIDRFDSGGRPRDMVEVPYPSEPDMVQSADGRWHQRMRQQFYRSCTYIEGDLWAVYSGAEKPFDSGDGKEVHVFNSAGRLVRRVLVDRPISWVVAAPGGRSLFVTSGSGRFVGRLVF